MSKLALKSSRFISLLVVVLFISSLCQAQSPIQPARVWESTLVIPTYELGPPDPNPALAPWQQRKKRPVYPYAVLDNLTHTRVDKTYRAVYLENGYLRVTVLPDLGGRLYEIFDK